MCLPLLCLWLSSRRNALDTLNTHAAIPEPTVLLTADETYPTLTSVLASMRLMNVFVNAEFPRPIPTTHERPVEKLLYSTLAAAWGFGTLKPELGLKSQVEIKLVPYRTDLDRTAVYSLPKNDLVQSQYVHSTRDLAVVYKLECVPVAHQYTVVSADYIDKTLKDYWFLREIYRLAPNLVPDPFHLSSAHFSTKSLTFGSVPTSECQQDRIPLVRYMVMELLPGLSVGSVIANEPEAVLTVKAIDATIAMITAISSLHKLNIIHGDAHADNFIWIMNETAQLQDVPKSTMKILDFEQSSVLDKQAMNIASPRCTLALPLRRDRRDNNLLDKTSIDVIPSYKRIRHIPSFHAWSAPWEYINCPKSFRNDVHKIFTSLARWMHGEKYLDLFNQLRWPARWELENGTLDWKKAPSAMEFLYYKMNGQIFELQGEEISKTERAGLFKIENTLIGYDLEIIDSIRDKFHQLENTLFNPPIAIEQRPDYEKIVTILESIKPDIIRGKPQH